MDKNLLIAATVIATIAYQAAISPPGGVAAVDAAQGPVSPAESYTLKPSNSLLAYFYTDLSNAFWISNTISFMAASSVIFLHVSGTSLKRVIIIWVLRFAMWVTLSSMIVAYVCAVIATAPSNTRFRDIDQTLGALIMGVIAWVGLLSLSFFVLVFHLVRYMVSKITGQVQAPAPVPEAKAPDNDIV